MTSLSLVVLLPTCTSLSFSLSSFYFKPGQSAETKVHPEMKIQSLSTHPHGDPQSGEVLFPTQKFWSFSAEQRRSILLSN